jgi:predicted nucleotidyltransferase
MDDRLQTIPGELRRGLESLYGDRLARLVLFGSQARGDAAPDSDIDVLVVLKGTVDVGDEILYIGGVVADLSLAYNTVVSCVFVPLDRFLTERSPLLLNVRRDGVTI